MLTFATIKLFRTKYLSLWQFCLNWLKYLDIFVYLIFRNRSKIMWSSLGGGGVTNGNGKDAWTHRRLCLPVGGRFTLPAESHYSPTEGECLAVAVDLEQSKFYTLGCPRLYIATYHNPLVYTGHWIPLLREHSSITSACFPKSWTPQFPVSARSAHALIPTLICWCNTSTTFPTHFKLSKYAYQLT